MKDDCIRKSGIFSLNKGFSLSLKPPAIRIIYFFLKTIEKKNYPFSFEIRARWSGKWVLKSYSDKFMYSSKIHNAGVRLFPYLCINIPMKHIEGKEYVPSFLKNNVNLDGGQESMDSQSLKLHLN